MVKRCKGKFLEGYLGIEFLFYFDGFNNRIKSYKLCFKILIILIVIIVMRIIKKIK